MPIIYVREDSRKHKDSLDWALREFKKMVKKEGILQDLKKHESYMTPSQKKKFRKNEAMKRRKRDEKKQEWYHKSSRDE